jgi:hypothetical protein
MRTMVGRAEWGSKRSFTIDQKLLMRTAPKAV